MSGEGMLVDEMCCRESRDLAWMEGSRSCMRWLSRTSDYSSQLQL